MFLESEVVFLLYLSFKSVSKGHSMHKMVSQLRNYAVTVGNSYCLEYDI